MTLPTSVASSSAYDENSLDPFTFGIDYNGYWYFVDSSLEFDLVVTEWGSVGNVVRGTFTGRLKNGSTTATPATITLTNGIFETTNNTDHID